MNKNAPENSLSFSIIPASGPVHYYDLNSKKTEENKNNYNNIKMKLVKIKVIPSKIQG